MFRKLFFCILLLFTGMRPLSAAQSTSGKEKSPAPKSADSSAAKPGTIETRVEQYLRNLYAWGPDFDVKVGSPTPSPITDLLKVSVTVSMGGQSDTAVVYVSKTGIFLLRGELTDMSVDPFAEVRSKLHVGDSPSMGPNDAKVTLIEFADFECPSCRQLDVVLRELLQRHPEVRLVFKHYPLTDIHPWAMTAAIASQCAYQQSPAAFWKIHDAIFDAQDAISPSNAPDKLQDLAVQVGLNPDAYKACMINPETANQVKKTIEEGHALTITATPTTFVNNRRVVGPDNSILEQYIRFNSFPAH
ncbi:MAG TPA: DsbA family protein [Candidatus Acidoferrum sp.]|nr:DsbA family protein [Candidatus Acidoferrum sp.]